MIGGQTSLDISPTAAYNPGSNKLMTIRQYGYSTAHYIYDLRRKTHLETHVIHYATSTFPALLRRPFTIRFIFQKMVFRNFIFFSSNSIHVLHTPSTKN